MSGYECYKQYLALKTHFTQESYNYFKYNKTFRVEFDSYVKRKDRMFFEKISKKYTENLEEFLISNFVSSNFSGSNWIGSLLDQDADNKYKDWKERQNTLLEMLRGDCKKIKEKCSGIINAINHRDSTHPALFSMFLGGHVSIETMIMLNSNYRFMGDWNLRLEKDPLWSSKFMLIKKYRPFLTFDLGNVKNVCNEAFST